MNTSARFQVIETPVALPGDCLLCKRADGPFIDTGLYIEFHGAVYLCVSCLADIGNTLGYLPPGDAEKLKTQVDALEKTVYRLTKKEASLEEAVGGLVAARALDGYSAGELVRRGNPVSADDEGPRSSGEPVGVGEGTPPEPSHDEGVGVVYADGNGSSDGDPFDLSL